MNKLYLTSDLFICQAHFWTVERSAPQFSVFLDVQWPSYTLYRTHVYITIASHGELSLLNIIASLLASNCF